MILYLITNQVDSCHDCVLGFEVDKLSEILIKTSNAVKYIESKEDDCWVLQLHSLLEEDELRGILIH